MSGVARRVVLVLSAAAIVAPSSPALAEPPVITRDTVEDVPFLAVQLNASCAQLGYQPRPRLPLTFTRTTTTIDFSGDRMIEIQRITGTITGTTGVAATFRAVRVFAVRPDGSEQDAGLSYQYRIRGQRAVIVTQGRDDRADPERFRPLCVALLGPPPTPGS